MPSLIPGFEYDIFISYRQKDNKYDGWVSEFVDNLKKELEATFKEEISVYFDINPTDGLLETHDVGESLKDKLKCLIFIPIISRTYCDPKSFAWENEFRAFIEQASKDRFGLKIKLPNGNVASRVLPIIIYDLDKQDIKLCEFVLGSILRGIEFIYKEPGVNRPLKPDDDEKINLNKTKYRNQINKVGNAIKEIINTMIQGEQKEEEIHTEAFKPVSAPQKNRKTIIIAVSIIALVLIILGILVIPKLFKPSEELEKSIAVLPFELLSDEPDKQYLADGMMDAVTLHLSKIKDLRVLGRTSTEQYRNPIKTLAKIGDELGVNYLLEGSFQKFGDSVRLIVQLIKTGKEGHIWADEYDKNWNDVFTVQSDVAQSIAKELNAAITPEEKQQIEEIPTKKINAYEYYLLGNHRLTNHIKDEDTWKAIEYFQQSIILDSTFILGYTGLANAYYQLVNYAIASPNEAWPKAHEFSIKALELNAKLAESHCMLGLIKQSFEYDFNGAEKEHRQALEIDPGNYNAHLFYMYFLSMMGRHKEAKEHADYLLKLEPMSYQAKLQAYVERYYAGYKSEAMKLMENLRDSYPDNPYGYWFCAVFYTDLGMHKEALSMLQTEISLMGSDNTSDEIGQQGYLYGKLGQKDKALKQFDRLDSLSSEGYYIAPRTRAWVYLGINNVDRAIEILEQSFRDHTFDPLYLDIYPTGLVNEDQRFIELRKKVGLLQ